MKILLVSSFFPYPLYSGGQVRLFNLIKKLGALHEITLVAECRKDPDANDYKTVKKYCRKIVTVHRKKQWSIRNILTSAVSPFPFLMVGHSSRDFRNIIKNELQEDKYDLIHVETFYVMQNLPKTDIPVVLVEHNIEYQVYTRWIRKIILLPLRPLLSFDVFKMKLWEKRFWRRAEQVVVVSDADRREVEKAVNKQVEIVANGVDCDYFSSKTKDEQIRSTVLFVGSFRWIQNLDACHFLLKRIWPEIIKLMPEAKLLIVGNEASKKIKNNSQLGVTVVDKVNDIRQIYHQATLMLAPVRIGGGTKFKILESMASCLAVVTTPLGAEGIESEDKMCVGKNTNELVELTVDLLKDSAKRRKYEKNAYTYIKEKFDWQDIAVELERVYRKAVNKYENRI